jgi:superfamily I DNA/RNA helicase/RecB family exonuclease
METIRLLGPDLGSLPALRGPEQLDPPQGRALEHWTEGADVLVHGAPGSGRSAVALAAAAQGARGADGATILLLPRRTLAARARDALAVHGIPDLQVMTPPALGYALLRAESIAQGRGEPTLVTGAEQDALLAELISLRTDWHLDIDPAALRLPGFRAELRDLITRATERGLRPEDLDRMGRERERPAWRDAAEILRDYLGVLDLESASALDAGPRLDSGALVQRAAQLLDGGAIAPPARRIVVDDAQDLTTAGIALVLAVARAGAQLLLTSSPDAAVDTFRGARVEAAQEIAEQLGRPLAEVVLTGVHGPSSRLAGPIDALRGRLPLAGAPAATRRQREGAGSSGLAVLRARDPLDEARLIGSTLRDLHHREQIPYDQMAVICRSGGAVTEVADLLAREGLPVRTPRRPRPLREEPVVADLLAIVEIGLQDGPEHGALPDPLQVGELLTGPFGDADVLRLHRIRRRLRAQDAPVEEILARALVDPEAPELPDPVRRVRAMVTAAREVAGAGAQQVIWAAWEASGLATPWRRAALGAAADSDGARARMASGRLDALMTLFAAAERLTDRRPGAGALELIEQVRGQAVAEDTLAAAAPARGTIAVLTPAQLAGEHRDTVVLARLQEGTWPNLRLRSTLFGASELALPPLDAEALRAIQREQVLADELRLAVSALARARTRVLVTAVDGGPDEPSALLRALEQLATDPWIDLEQLRADPGPAPDARHLVATLRRHLRQADDRAADAALALRELAAAGAPGADPAAWYHQHPSSEEPLREPDAELGLSPSALERAAACPRSWLLERSGGTRTGSAAPAIGTALHRLAQEHPRGAAAEDLLTELHGLLRGVPGLETWSGRRRVRHAEDAARLLAEHLQSAGEPLAVEAPFEVEVAGVTLRGTIDRIDGDPTGLRVVDLKSGRTAKTAAAAEEDLQLAAYQAAIRDGALDEQLGPDAAARLNGAQLVYVGTGGRRAAVRTQTALPRAENPVWFDEIVTRVAAEVSGAQVTARRNPHCSMCSVRSSCPLQPEGQQLDGAELSSDPEHS